MTIRRHLPRNNDILTDLARNLTVTAAQINAAVAALAGSTEELGVVDLAIASVQFTVEAGAENVCIFSFAIYDADGALINDRRALRVYISEDPNGDGVSADNYSGGATVTDGELVATISANKVFDLITGADGAAAISIEDSGAPADQYLVVQIPITGEIYVSGASATNWGAGA